METKTLNVENIRSPNFPLKMFACKYFIQTLRAVVNAHASTTIIVRPSVPLGASTCRRRLRPAPNGCKHTKLFEPLAADAKEAGDDVHHAKAETATAYSIV